MVTTAAPSLPYETLYLLQIARYVPAACLTVCLWDWCLTLSDEFEMINHGKQFRRYLFNMLYFIVRICPITYLVAVLMLANGSTSYAVVVLISVLNMIIIPAGSALFFVRLRAVYSHKKYVLGFFILWWLSILGLFIFDSARGLSRCLGIVQSTQCFTDRPDALAYLATTSYDTLMYGFISWKLASFAWVDRWQDWLRSFFTGDGLGWLSKVLLQSGQTYYFITVVFNILTTVFVFSPSLRSDIFITPNVTVSSIMACQLFRELKLGLIVGPMPEGAISELLFRDIVHVQQQTKHSIELHRLDYVDVQTGIANT